MPTAHIKLACQQIIDASSSTPFEQQVFHATYQEFLLQQQSFSKGLDLFTWSAIRERFPKSHPTLPFKVSFAIAGLLRSLDKKIPGLTDTLGIKPIRFVNHYFQLLESDSRNPSAHKVSIIYLTDPLVYFGNFGDSLLLAESDGRTGPTQTFFLKLDDKLSIVSYEELFQPVSETSSPLSCALPGQASLFP
ncbi:MAG TPA: hypothetical protein VHD83_27010 [Puia sp.]|nr:hypothetical protein [Puia sp.]